ncbi:MAG TPA: hypothetical protein VNT99_19780 [Methylomirabilota bacterium]|nr:hypothetical protein [Methylomirabilota bacterium]
MKSTFFVRLCPGAIVTLAVLLPLAAMAQVSPLLRLNSIQVAPGNPVQFTFSDSGSGATNYVVEFAPAVGAGGSWSNVSGAVITSLGGGNYQVTTALPQTTVGFFRVRGLGGSVALVTASFSMASLNANEGTMVAPTIVFSAPFIGTVRYTIGGTAASGDYVSSSGEVFVNGTTATIPITLTDNQLIGQLKSLTLTLEAGAGYQLGATSQNTINILENDADWQGSFISEDATIGFVLRIQEFNGVHTASVKSDGFGFFPTNETPASITFNANFFSATAQNISIPPTATLLNSEMLLTLSLSAANGVTNQSVTPTQIEGAAMLVTAVVGQSHLNTTNQGRFLLIKPPVAPSTNQVQLTNVP